MDIIEEGSRIVLREPGNQRFTGVFIIVLGVFFMLPELAMFYDSGEPVWFLVGVFLVPFMARNRDSGALELEYDGRRIQFRSSVPWGVDESVDVDSIKLIRRRDDSISRRDTEVSILTPDDRLVMRLNSQRTTWLEAKLRYRLSSHSSAPANR